jgi:PAS domain S-box-containing protein
MISRMVDDIFIDTNQRFQQTFGYTREELLGQRGLKFELFNDPDERSAIIERLHENSSSTNIEVAMRRRDGSTVQMLFSVETIPMGGENCLLSTFSDISGQKQVEEQLRRSQTALKRAQAVAKVGSWVWTIKNNHLAWSDEMYSLFKIDQEHFSGSVVDVVEQRVHPDDRPAVEQWNRMALNSEKPMPLEYRLVMPDQTIRVVRGEIGEFTFDENGALSELSGVIQDVTEQRRVDMALQLSQERYRNLVELSPDAVFVTHNNQIEFVNPAALALFGAAESKQLLGKSPFDLFHPDYHASIAERIQKMAVNGVSVPILQEKIIRLDGSVRDVEVAASSVTDTSGSVIQVILRDITERKQAERQLNDQLYELRRWNSATLGREKRVLELKAEVNQLLAHMGQPARYPSVQQTDRE